MAKSSFTISDGTKVTTPPDKADDKIEHPDDFSVEKFVDELKDDLKHDRLNLPTIPTISLEALMVLNDVDSSVDDLVKVISKDTSLTARLIKYANSPLYRMSYPISSIKPAITCIGFQKVKHAIYAVSMKEVFRTSVSDIQRRMEELWEHSVKVGAKAAELAKSQPEFDPEVALVAGLVHDVGKIPLLAKLCDYEEVVAHEEFLDKLLHKLHARMGKAILKLWEFGPDLIAVAAEHDDIKRQPKDGKPDYADLIQVANILSYDGTDHPLASLDKDSIGAFKRLNITIEESSDESDVGGVEEMLF